ncbi:MAG: hypothetical protein J6I61_06765, partial [Prevotella sp.]|nr:hypothetical protein [Prevotella sp.]
EGGHYYVPQTIKRLANAYTLIGGYDPATHADPIYPTTGNAVTLIDGDRNMNGVADEGDAERCFSIQTATSSASSPQKPVVIRGFDFVNMYDKKGTTTHGAIQLNNSHDVTIENCRFKNNTTAYSTGGMAIFNNRSTIFVRDCEFVDNAAGNRGGAFYETSDNGGKGGTVFERCLFSGNKITTPISDENKTALGSAICYTNGPVLWIVNSTITGNESPAGGAIYATGADATWKRIVNIVSSTIADNKGGNQINMTQGACMHLVNSYIAGTEDEGTLANTAIAITGATEKTDFFEITSLGHNVIGGYVNQVENATAVPTWDATDKQGPEYTYDKIFGTNVLTDKGYIQPVISDPGADATTLASTIAGWDPTSARVDLTVDQTGAARKGNTTAGAYASSVATHLYGVVAPRNMEDAKTYSLGGVMVSNATKGIFIKNGKKLLVK